MNEEEGELQKKINKGAFWLVLLRTFLKFISLISTLILVRLLLPEDFGLIALAMSFIAMIELVGAFGFESAVIQTHNATDDHYSSVWTLRILVNSSMAIIAFLFAPSVADFYGSPLLTTIIQILTPLFIINALVNPGLIFFTKNMDFEKEFMFKLSNKVVAFLVTISAALILENYYALIIGMYSASLSSLFFSYWLSDFRPRVTIVFVKELFGFSKWMTINAWLNYLNTRTSELVLGYYSGVKLVGLYNISHEISTLPSTEIGAAMNRASYSGYAQTNKNKSLLQKMYFSVLYDSSIMTIPAGIGIFLISFEISHVLLGEGWEQAEYILRILALGSVFSALSTNHQYVYMALGKPKFTTALSFIRFIIFGSLLIGLTSTYGIEGAAYAFLLSAILYFPIPLILTKRLLNFTLSDYFKKLVPPVIASSLLYLTLWTIFGLNNQVFDNLLLQMLLKICIGAIVYIAVLYCFFFFAKEKSTGLDSKVFSFTRIQFEKSFSFLQKRK